MRIVPALPAAVPAPEAAPPDGNARLRAVVDACFATVWRTLKRLGVPEASADDAAQQVLLVAARRLDEIELGGERAYLVGVAVRVAADWRRTLRRRAEVPLPIDLGGADAGGGPLPDDLLDEKRARSALASLLAEMPVDMREAFVLFEIEEMSAPEVAAALGVAVGTVASRVRRAREHIRQRLAERGGPR